MSKRILNELKSLEQEMVPAIKSLTPVEGNLGHLEAMLIGPPDTPYEKGIWKIEIKIPSDYPMIPPEMRFVTRICHPNIHFKTGEICLDILSSQWTPTWTVPAALMAIQALLSSPEPDSPLNIDAANLYRAGDFKAYNGLVCYYRELYAARHAEA